MARIDNLQNFIEDIGQAIKDKKGIPQEQKIQVRNFDTEIASIETGGGGGSLEYLMRNSNPAGSKAILTQDGDGTLKAVIPEGVTSIGDYAFRYNQLKSVVIPDSVTSISSYAFSDNKLTSVVIPNSVINIGALAFSDNQLISVVIPDSVTSIGIEVFRNNQLTSVVIPNSVSGISDYAFYYNQLKSVVIPDSVTSIRARAFANNELTEIIFESEIPPTIQSNTFNDNPDLNAIYVPDNAVDTYKAMTNYVQFADIIKPISERPE